MDDVAGLSLQHSDEVQCSNAAFVFIAFVVRERAFAAFIREFVEAVLQLGSRTQRRDASSDFEREALRHGLEDFIKDGGVG